jgi:cytoskeletal protein RodZ
VEISAASSRLPSPPRLGGVDVGAILREARDRRGLSLDQISHATKISVSVLRNIEQNQIEKLPHRVFLRGFLSAYAREVGLNPEETVQRYLREFESAPDIVATPTPDVSEAPRPPRGQAVEERKEAWRRFGSVEWVATVMLAVIVVGSYAIARRRHAAAGVNVAAQVETAQSSPATPSMTAPAVRPETATAGSRDTGRPAATNRQFLRIEMRPQGACWLAATVDGTRVAYGLMQAGERQTIEMHDEAVIRVGDPAAFAFSIDGSAGHPLGRAGRAVTVHITRQNYREFLEQ